MVFDAILRDLVRKYLRGGIPAAESVQHGLEDDKAIRGVAAVLAGLTQNNRCLEEHVFEWLTSTTGEYASFGLDTRRAVIATLALKQGRSPDKEWYHYVDRYQKSYSLSLTSA